MRTPRKLITDNKKYKYPHEVFNEIEKLNSFHYKLNYLRENSSFAIKTILQCNFSPNITLDLPDGAPPFRKDVMPPEMTPARIDKAIKVLGKMARFPGQPASSGLSRIKLETLFINLLETVNENDANIIIAMKEKTLSKMYPSIDDTLVKAAFPELFNM
jgi:hypothetical protein